MMAGCIRDTGNVAISICSALSVEQRPRHYLVGKCDSNRTKREVDYTQPEIKSGGEFHESVLLCC